MKTKLAALLLCLPTPVLCFSALGQGTAFTYQGRLNDGANPAAGVYDLRFVVYDSADAGTLVAGPLTNSSIAISNGLFTATLDFGANPFTGAARWLEIGVRSNAAATFTTLSPRQPLTATPYAVYAGSVSASGIAGSIADNQLSANIARLNSNLIFTGAVQFNNASNTFNGAFIGNGAGVTNVNLMTANSQGAITWTNIHFPGIFTLVSSPTVGTNPRWVVAADVNGDGKLDLICSDQGGHSLTVLTNTGSGGFVIASSPNVGNFPQSVVAADVNGDGKVDLISANNSDNNLTVLTNNGSGGFVLASTPPVGSGPQVVVAADVNGDGKLDLIDANYNDNTLTVLTNNGSGAFVTASSPVVGANPLCVVAADVNGDGKVDLISANSGSQALTVLTNTGNGAFVIASSPGVGGNPFSVAAADVNGDGKVDLITANSLANTLTVLTNNGNGGFVVASSPAAGLFPHTAIAADVNGDGKADLICANLNSATLTVLTNNGSGGFALASSPGIGTGSTSVAAADLNGDGRLDLVSVNYYSNTLAVLFNTADPNGPFSAIFNGNFSGPLAASQLVGTIAPTNIANGTISGAMLATGAVGSNQLAAGAVVTTTLADGAVTAIKVATVTNNFMLTITNPAPAVNDAFGATLLAVGTDRLLIGASGKDVGATDSGAAYLYTLNGVLLTTFTNPIPGVQAAFGRATAALGNDRLIFGASSDNTGGASYGVTFLFGTEGSLLLAITNPTPAVLDFFGDSVAAVRNDRLLIGAPYSDVGATNAGVAYLYSTNGALLTTFTNPTPELNDAFGSSLAAVGPDRLIIGAPYDNTGATSAGAAYLFNTNGTLLVTFTNPTPAVDDSFGSLVAAVGTDRVLINSPYDNGSAGAVHLFTTNGTLLTTFTNPHPGSVFFGLAMTVVGTDRVLIAAPEDNTGANNAGVAYLFNTNGTLLNTFTNPTPATGDLFGDSVAAVGGNGMVISAPVDNTGATGAGTAYLFGTESYNPGLVAEKVRNGSITAESLADGAITATKISGTLLPSQIPGLDASKIISGTLSDARLSSNVALRASANTFTAANTFNGNVGISTPSPQAQFNVNGTARIDATTAPYSEGLTLNLPTDMPSGGYGGITFHNTARGGAYGPSTIRWGIYYNYTPENGTTNNGLAFFRNNLTTSLYLSTNGNVGIGTLSPTNKLHVAGGVSATVFVTTSDRNAKENFARVSPLDVLEKVAALPITRWTFKEMPGQEHLGPMAQDFHAAFNLGSGDTGIATVDEEGVALAAIQGLNQKVEVRSEKDESRMQRLETENVELKRQNATLEQRLETLEKIVLEKKSH